MAIKITNPQGTTDKKPFALGVWQTVFLWVVRLDGIISRHDDKGGCE